MEHFLNFDDKKLGKGTKPFPLIKAMHKKKKCFSVFHSPLL